jgi:hypothetical protein
MEGFKEKIREMERLVFTIKIHQICLACVFRGPANLSLNQFYSNNTVRLHFLSRTAAIYTFRSTSGAVLA